MRVSLLDGAAARRVLDEAGDERNRTVPAVYHALAHVGEAVPANSHALRARCHR